MMVVKKWSVSRVLGVNEKVKVWTKQSSRFELFSFFFFAWFMLKA